MVQPAGPYDADTPSPPKKPSSPASSEPLGLYQHRSPSMLRRAAQLLHRVGLAAVANHSYQSLSSGEKVRALIARAMVNLPRLLILRRTHRRPGPPRPRASPRHDPIPNAIQKSPDSRPDHSPHRRATPANPKRPPIRPRKTRSPRPQVLNPKILSKVYGVKVEMNQSSGRFYAQVHPIAWTELLK